MCLLRKWIRALAIASIVLIVGTVMASLVARPSVAILGKIQIAPTSGAAWISYNSWFVSSIDVDPTLFASPQLRRHSLRTRRSYPTNLDLTWAEVSPDFGGVVNELSGARTISNVRMWELFIGCYRPYCRILFVDRRGTGLPNISIESRNGGVGVVVFQAGRAELFVDLMSTTAHVFVIASVILVAGSFSRVWLRTVRQTGLSGARTQSEESPL